MRLLITGDWHTTNKAPENRIDDFVSSLFKKIKFIAKIYKDKKCDFVLQPGDFFDSPFIPYSFFASVFELLSESGLQIAAIYGQHDLRYRTKENTPLTALWATSDFLQVIPATGLIYNNEVAVYGASFGEEVPNFFDEGHFNVLLVHQMIVDEKLWASQEGHTLSGHFLKKHKKKFDLIVSGDNHQFFIESGKLFNMGSLMRSRIDQVDHEPSVVVFDTDTLKWERILIPVEKNVFDFSKVTSEKERDAKIEAFVEGLSETKVLGFDFEANLRSRLREIGDEELTAFLNLCLGEIKQR